MGAALKFQQASLGRQPGEKARLRVLGGPDQGSIFIITRARFVIGRSKEADVQIADLKSSRKHVEVTHTPDGWFVNDLKSANGFKLNSVVSTHSKIKPGDSLTIGDTTLEFLTEDLPTQLLLAPPRDLMQVQREQAGFEVQRARVRALGKAAPAPVQPVQSVGSTQKPANKGPKLLLMGLLAVVVVVVLSNNDGQKPVRVKKKPVTAPSAEEQDITKLLRGETSSLPKDKSAEGFFRSGFREYREGNFMRARAQFETALQLDPTHLLSKRYLDNSIQAIQEEIKTNLEQGRKAMGAGKLKEAKGRFEAVLRLLYRDQNNPHFLEAKEHLTKINESLRENLIESTPENGGSLE